MLRYLLLRPIAVSVILIAALAISLLVFFQLPVSLLPAIDVPEITIAVRYPNGSPEEIEQNILKPIRESMLTLNGIKTSESLAQNEAGKITLQFDFGTAMDLAYIEANEKIDRLTPLLPPTLERPLVIKSSTADIPILRVQMVPLTDPDLQIASQLANKVLKRRLEQIAGVGIVDLNGTVRSIVRITPNTAVMQSLGLTDKDLITTIANANLELGSVSVKDGNYRYYLKLGARIGRAEDVEELPVLLPNQGAAVLLKQIATATLQPEKQSGFHLFQNQEGIVITIHKQAQARMPELMPKLYAAVEQFKLDYPAYSFHLTQDQSLLLSLSIQNLSQALVWGGAIAFGVLFLFMRGWREPLIMGIVLPLSLLLAFSVFAIFKISFNIISLSGLALGLGMLVDNSIVVIDSIMLKRRTGEDLLDSCVSGTQEVIVPLITSALTNLAVFIPLIFLSGLTGALFYDQAVSVAAILSVSLLCTFLVVPLLYLLFFKNKIFDAREDSRFFTLMRKGYTRTFGWVWRNKKLSLALMTLLLPATIVLLIYLPKQGFPQIARTETVISIDWNEPIDAIECRNRVGALLAGNENFINYSEAEVGYQQFLLGRESYSVQHAEIYIAYKDERTKTTGDRQLKAWLNNKFPLAAANFTNAPNAFEQLFANEQPMLEARFRDLKAKRPLAILRADSLVKAVGEISTSAIGKGFEKETMAFITIDFTKLQQYQIDYAALIEKLKLAFGDYLITDFTNFGEALPVMFAPYAGDFNEAFQNLTINSAQGIGYPIKELVQVQFRESYRYITSDAGGVYQAIAIHQVDDVNAATKAISDLATNYRAVVDFSGKWFNDQKNFRELGIILLVSVLLMYFILTAEFESLKQPLLVMVTLPLGLAGSLLLLWITGGTINIMSGIGLIVVLGVLDNDAILKIDRINRLKALLPLEEAIHQAGLDRLKPIVMNTCTNVLAITPIIFSTGLGADLQRPVAITTIGGLIVGTFTALYFIPLVYWFSTRKKN